MKCIHKDITFLKLDKNEQPPYEFLLLADPSKKIIDEYLKLSDIFLAKLNGETIGVIVLYPLPDDKVEIKNIAVKPEYQGSGIGSFMIKHMLVIAAKKNRKSILIGTANSSIRQLYLYQKLGFEISALKMNFFTDHYAEHIFENGIQAKHMVVLTKDLLNQNDMQ